MTHFILKRFLAFGSAMAVAMALVMASSCSASDDVLANTSSLTAHLKQSKAHSVVVYHKGKLAYEFGPIDEKLVIHSMRKPLLNSLYGVFVDKGVIDLSQTLDSLGIDDIEPLTDSEKQATIGDLLKSRSGIYHDSTATSEGMKAQLPERGRFKPNAHYAYNNWDFNVAGAIFEQLADISIYDAFDQYIAKPIGMTQFKNDIGTIKGDQDFRGKGWDGFFQYETNRSKYPAYHFRLSARDLAKFGQLYLNKGMWDEKQILSEAWIDKSTTAYSTSNTYMDFGYGLLWAVQKAGKKRTHKAFFHTGSGIHMIAVYPKHDLVFVHRVNTEVDHDFKESDLYKTIGLVFESI